MAVDPQLTEAQVRALASTESFARGREYQDEGAVVRLSRRGDQLLAEVEGSDYAPYEVTVTLDAGGIVGYDCTCPYDWGGACKHIVASLLATIEEPEEVEQRPALDTLLAGLSADQLRGILTTLAKERPTLADVVESQVLLLRTPPAGGDGGAASPPAGGAAAPRERHTPLDPKPFAAQVRAAFRAVAHLSSSDAYGQADGVLNTVDKIVAQADPYLDAGDGRNALVILEAVTSEYLARWTDLDDSDGEFGGFIEALSAPWTAAILSADLTPAERETWVAQFAAWEEELDDYGLDNAFAAPAEAARQGWDYPPLLRVLRGEITEQGAWADEPPSYADELAQARLKVLEQQGRTQEYLYLAEAESQMDLYVIMLVKLGRVAEAVDAGLQSLGAAAEALAAAQALRARGAIPEALRVAEHGLTLQGPQAALARWLRDLAAGAGDLDRALAAAQVAMREEPNLANYEAIRAVAGDRWSALREEVLAALRQGANYYPRAQVEIFLHEGLIDDAIASVATTTAPELLEPVIAAAIPQRPGWVVARCERLATGIIEEGKSKYYSQAAQWLAQAGAAARVAGQEAVWRATVQDLLTRHRRKYSLTPLLEALLKGR